MNTVREEMVRLYESAVTIVINEREAPEADADIKPLRDGELALVGGGDGTPSWP